MDESLGRKLIEAIDATWTNYSRNSTVRECSCSFCRFPVGCARAPSYAVVYTLDGTLFYPICIRCIEQGIRLGKAAGVKYLASERRRQASI